MRFKKIIFKPRSVREVKKYLKLPRSRVSAVLYFTDKDNMPFLLGADKSGISSQATFKLGKKWKLNKEKLERIYIITTDVDSYEDGPEYDAKDDEEDGGTLENSAQGGQGGLNFDEDGETVSD